MHLSLFAWLIAYLVICSECIFLSTFVSHSSSQSWTGILFVVNWIVVLIIIQYKFYVQQHIKKTTHDQLSTSTTDLRVDLSTSSKDNSAQKFISHKNLQNSAKCSWFTSILANVNVFWSTLVMFISGAQLTSIILFVIIYLIQLCIYHCNYNRSTNGRAQNMICICPGYRCSFCFMFYEKIQTLFYFCIYVAMGVVYVIDDNIFPDSFPDNSIIICLQGFAFGIWNIIFIANYCDLYHTPIIKIVTENQDLTIAMNDNDDDDHGDSNSSAKSTTNLILISPNNITFINRIKNWLRVHALSQTAIFSVNAILTIIFAAFSLIVQSSSNHNYCTASVSWMIISLNCWTKIATIGIGVAILIIVFLRWLLNKVNGKIAWSLNDFHFRGAVLVKVIFFMIKPALIMESDGHNRLDYIIELSFQILMFFTTTGLAIATYNGNFKNLELLEPIMPRAKTFARLYIVIYIICICSTYSILIDVIVFKLYHYDSNWTDIIYTPCAWIIFVKLYLNEISQLINFHLQSREDGMKMVHNLTSQHEVFNAIKRVQVFNFLAIIPTIGSSSQYWTLIHSDVYSNDWQVMWYCQTIQSIAMLIAVSFSAYCLRLQGH